MPLLALFEEILEPGVWVVLVDELEDLVDVLTDDVCSAFRLPVVVGKVVMQSLGGSGIMVDECRPTAGGFGETDGVHRQMECADAGKEVEMAQATGAGPGRLVQQLKKPGTVAVFSFELDALGRRRGDGKGEGSPAPVDEKGVFERVDVFMEKVGIELCVVELEDAQVAAQVASQDG